MADKNTVFDELKLPIQAIASKTAISPDSLPNSIMNRQQANRFIDMVVDASVLLKNIRTKKVDHPKGDINRLDLGDIATEGANTTSTNTLTTPSESVIEYDMEKYRTAFDLKSDFLDDNIEGTAARDTILNMFSKRMSMDTELAAIESDDSLPTGDGQTRLNNLLGVNNGFLKILGANVPAAQILNAGNKATTKKLFYDMKRKIPAKYRVAKPSYVWLVSSSTFDKWTYEWTGRATSGGDSALSTGMAPGPFGIPMFEVPMLTESLSYNGGAANTTVVILTPLQNLIFFMQREITIEWDRRPRQDKWEVTIHWKGDFMVEEPEMVILGQNINPDGTDYA